MTEKTEIERKRDDAIRRALSTPPKPNSAYVGEGKSAPPKRRGSKSKAVKKGK